MLRLPALNNRSLFIAGCLILVAFSPPLVVQVQSAFDAAGAGTVIGDRVRLRTGPGVNKPVVGAVTGGQMVAVVGRAVGWYRVEAGQDGWIAEDYLRLDLEGRIPQDSRVGLLLRAAQSLLGRPYAYAQAGPAGFDCSGFTSYVFRQFGVGLPRSAEDQMHAGTRVERDALSAGDLVFFTTDGRGRVSHVGIYLFDGEFIHASSGRGRVTTSTMREGYYDERYVGAVRIQL
ncbi:MAG: C40 family peptidase [Bacteroidota bacterium]